MTVVTRRRKITPTPERNLTPPEVAQRYGVANTKVRYWIHAGELAALNLAHSGCTRPRYSITHEALAAFEQSRTVIPDGGLSTTKRLRRQAASGVKEFF